MKEKEVSNSSQSSDAKREPLDEALLRRRERDHQGRFESVVRLYLRELCRSKKDHEISNRPG